ncbi:MAG: SbcC/MukB-like Walker B domain-containing protein [Mobilitalea sp.]
MNRYQALTKMCLNNWHYINEKVLNFHEEINFFTGHSGSGKSTVLDALQIVLYADSNGRGFFNKAAKEDSDRSLLEYLRGMKVVQENNEISYLRNKNFSTTICLEFRDTELKKSQSLGVVFDVDVATNDVNRMFFWHSGEMASNCYREGDRVFSINEMKEYVQEHYNKEEYFFCRTNEKFRNELYSNYFGGLHPKHFPALFKKAIPFKMDMKLEDFVKNYICTENDIHMEDMQDSIAQYTRLKRRLEDTKQEIKLLSSIHEQYTNYQGAADQIKQYQYDLDKLDILMMETKLDKINIQQTEYKEDIEVLEKTIADLDNEITELQKQRDEVVFSIQNSGYEHLEAELGSINQMIELLSRSKAAYDKIAEGLKDWLQTDLLDSNICVGIQHFAEYKADRLEIEEIQYAIAGIHQEAESEKQELTAKIKELKIKLTEVSKQMILLNNGQKAYPGYLLEVKDILTKELEQIYEEPVLVDILADTIEIKEEAWRNAVEGYMGNNKLNLMVAPRYAKKAIEIYNSLDAKKYYKAAVIDTEKILKDQEYILKDQEHSIQDQESSLQDHEHSIQDHKNTQGKGKHAQANSLANEVETTTDYTKAYVNYLMGNVKKCSSIEELRENKSGITKDCILYQGYKIQHINPRNYTDYAYIGRSAIDMRLRQLESDFQELKSQEEPLQEQISKTQELLSLEALSNDIYFYENKLIEMKEIKQKEEQKKDYIRKIEELKKMNIDEWKAKKLLLEKVIASKNSQKETSSVDLRYKEKDIKEFSESILSLSEELIEKQKVFTEELSRESIFQKMIKEQENRKPESLRTEWINNKIMSETKTTTEFEKLLKHREQYRNAYAYRGFSLTSKENEEYDQLLTVLSSDKLNEFTEKANEQAVQAIHHFKTDFIYKVRDAIKEVMQQKEDLNKILSNLDFGKDKYKFIITKNRGEDGKFFDMFMDENLEINPHQLTGTAINQMDLFTMQHEKDHSDLINELIELFMPPENCDIKTLEEARVNMEKYADYRTYLSFDMEQLVEGMSPMRLSKMLSKNSGGEGQNPLYVALLASFAQVYRINQKSNVHRRPTPRLVVLDEAFSKMDAEKVGSCIGLIRKLGFQAIISATNDKIQNYVDNVDKSFVFANPNKNRIYVQEFEKKEFLELLSAQEEEEDERILD